MAETYRFRREFRGFNREDVVRYIDLMNKKHTGLVNQLKSENKALKDELASLREGSAAGEKDALITQLRAQVEALSSQAVPGEPATPSGEELEAYRRAERMERAAKERSDQIYRQATAALAEASGQVDDASSRFAELADRVSDQLRQLQDAVTGSKASLQDASAALYAIRPEATEE